MIAYGQRAAGRARFAALAERLQRALDVPLRWETGAFIQDASFHGEIALPDALLAAERVAGVQYSLRISNFGGMAAVDGEEHVLPEILAKVAAELREAGYTLVPARLLHRPYDGRVAARVGITEWWTRYFDFI